MKSQNYVINRKTIEFIREELNSHVYCGPWTEEFKDLCATILLSEELDSNSYYRQKKLGKIFYDYGLSNSSGLFDSRYTEELSSMVKSWKQSKNNKWKASDIFIVEGDTVSDSALKNMDNADLKNLHLRVSWEIDLRK